MDPEPNDQPSAAIAPAVVRKLVTLRQVTHTRPTGSNSNGQQLVTVDGGWNVVTNGDFTVDDHVLFFEIDSFIPTTTLEFSWEFYDQLEDFNGQRGYHVRSQMVGKNLSQGLILPTWLLPDIHQLVEKLKEESGTLEGLRIAKSMAFEGKLGVKKWEAPSFGSSAGSLVLGRAPMFIRQPGCPRIQDKPTYLTEEYESVFEITEKLDGIPMTIYRVQDGSQWDRALPVLPAGSSQRTPYGRVGIATRQHDIGQRADDMYWKAAKDIGLPSKFAQMAGLPNLAISGEFIGPGLNSSIPFAPGERAQFVVFQMFDIDHQTLLQPDIARAICNRRVLPVSAPHIPFPSYSSMFIDDVRVSFHDMLKGCGQALARE